ncbi:hypothetical protein RND81_11G218000 [Saponaria officinalis]|uniref:Fungal lipase-type domain-containing protein n=1 Tax=Saponaria officinalis TaxID=3572 RepID=A0AAW1HQ63_SAPOF
MDKNEFISSKYMHVSLLPNKEKATLKNLTKQFLFPKNNINESTLLSYNIPQNKENKYLHKGLIFCSLLIQILLKHLAIPMKKFGATLENFLNYTIILGEECRENGEFVSLIGHMDSRTELDKKIKYGDPRYYPALSMMASKLSYENNLFVKNVVSSIWKMEFVGFYNFNNEFLHKKTTQAFIMLEHNPKNDMIVVAFRGTSPFDADDWSTDFDFSWLKIKGMGKIHKGFMMALGLKKCFREDDEDELGDYYGSWPKNVKQDRKHLLAYYTIREKLREIMAKNKNAKFIVTGHSLGGALAILFPAILALHGEAEILDRLEAIYTYGQPRVGDEKFGIFMKNKLREHNIKYYRIVYAYDMVPTVPFDNTLMTFKHFGKCIHFNSLYQGKVIEEDEKPTNTKGKGEHPMEHIRILKEVVEAVIKRILATLCAVWQLIRGFIIGYVAGPEYKEGWVQICARILGVFLPGSIEHFPQDYVNATRLASENLFSNNHVQADD